jgi:hypothetical protein
LTKEQKTGIAKIFVSILTRENNNSKTVRRKPKV